MKFEYFRYMDPGDNIKKLKSGASFSMDSAGIRVQDIEIKEVTRVDLYSPHLPQEIMMVSLEITEKTGQKRRSKAIFRRKSKVVFYETSGDIITADYIYRFLSNVLGLDLYVAISSRDNLKRLIDAVRAVDVKVNTWRGSLSIRELPRDEMDPLLAYSLALAILEFDCLGKVVIRITTDSVQIDNQITEDQRECTFQLLESYLVSSQQG